MISLDCACEVNCCFIYGTSTYRRTLDSDHYTEWLTCTWLIIGGLLDYQCSNRAAETFELQMRNAQEHFSQLQLQ